jgi:hypothetical protein
MEVIFNPNRKKIKRNITISYDIVRFYNNIT